MAARLIKDIDKVRYRRKLWAPVRKRQSFVVYRELPVVLQMTLRVTERLHIGQGRQQQG